MVYLHVMGVNPCVACPVVVQIIHYINDHINMLDQVRQLGEATMKPHPYLQCFDFLWICVDAMSSL